MNLHTVLSRVATDAIGELEEAVGKLNAVLTLLENGNSEVQAKEQADAVE